MPQAINQIVLQSGVVKNLDEEAVRDCVELLREDPAIAIILLGGLRWLKPEVTLAVMGSMAKAVECLCLKPCFEGRVPSASMMDGRGSHSNIFTARQSSEMGQ